jgi:hypothetical protein
VDSARAHMQLLAPCGRCVGNAGHDNDGPAARHERKSGRTRKGNSEVRDILTECAWSAGKTASYIGAQFHRLHRRFGKKGGGKAAIAVAHTLIMIVWHALHDQTPYRELGHDYFTRRDNPDAARHHLIHRLEALGYHVELTATAGLWRARDMSGLSHRCLRPVLPRLTCSFAGSRPEKTPLNWGTKQGESRTRRSPDRHRLTRKHSPSSFISDLRHPALSPI